MAFNLFFNSKFDKLIDELGIGVFKNVIDQNKLIEMRGYSKDGLKEKPEEAATRVFRDLVLLNQSITVEKRLDQFFNKSHTIKYWCLMDGNVNIDLYKSVKALIEKMVSEYVGKNYEDDFYEVLNKAGVIIPIVHDELRTFGLMLLCKGKQGNISTHDVAMKFYIDILAKNADRYVSCVREEGRELLKTLPSIYKPIF